MDGSGQGLRLGEQLVEERQCLGVVSAEERDAGLLEAHVVMVGIELHHHSEIFGGLVELTRLDEVVGPARPCSQVSGIGVHRTVQV